MEYVWYTLLQRNVRFEEATVREWIHQFRIYKKVNGIEEQEKKNNKKGFIDDIF